MSELAEKGITGDTNLFEALAILQNQVTLERQKVLDLTSQLATAVADNEILKKDAILVKEKAPFVRKVMHQLVDAIESVFGKARVVDIVSGVTFIENVVDEIAPPAVTSKPEVISGSLSVPPPLTKDYQEESTNVLSLKIHNLQEKMTSREANALMQLPHRVIECLKKEHFSTGYTRENILNYLSTQKLNAPQKLYKAIPRIVTSVQAAKIIGLSLSGLAYRSGNETKSPIPCYYVNQNVRIYILDDLLEAVAKDKKEPCITFIPSYFYYNLRVAVEKNMLFGWVEGDSVVGFNSDVNPEEWPHVHNSLYQFRPEWKHDWDMPLAQVPAREWAIKFAPEALADIDADLSMSKYKSKYCNFDRHGVQRHD